jgi:putative addiction module component (TIGR02574 family)
MNFRPSTPLGRFPARRQLEEAPDRSLGKKPELHVGRVSAYIAAMSIEQIAAEALRLPAKERAMLAESLWESLADPFQVPASMDDSHAVALAIERDRQLESGEIQPISQEEMMARLRQ